MAKKQVIIDVPSAKFDKKKPTAAQAVRGLVSKVKEKQASRKKTAGKKAVPKTAEKPKTEKRKPHATRPTLEEQIKIEERRWQVWELYRACPNVRKIAEHLKAKGVENTSVGTIFGDIKWCLSQMTGELKFSIEEHRANELAILNDIHFTYYPLMKNTGMNVLEEDRTDAGKMVLATAKERIKLLGLDKHKIEVEIDAGKALAELLGIDEEDLPDDDDD